jgi:uncharacterized membrane protein
MRFLQNLSVPWAWRPNEIEPATGARMKAMFGGREGHGRSFAKAVSWRTVGTVDTFIISFVVTGKVSLAGGIAAIEVVTKIAIYYLHERVWAVIPWGHR